MLSESSWSVVSILISEESLAASCWLCSSRQSLDEENAAIRGSWVVIGLRMAVWKAGLVMVVLVWREAVRGAVRAKARRESMVPRMDRAQSEDSDKTEGKIAGDAAHVEHAGSRA